MFNRWSHARLIGAGLASSLAELERRSSSQAEDPSVAWDTERIARAIAETWQVVVDEAESGQFDLSVPNLGRVHKQLASAAGTEAPGQFKDKGELPGTEWSVTTTALLSACEGFDSSYLTDAVILASLRWAGHVQSVALSLGWLCLNGVHLRGSVWAIYPPPADHDRLIEYLAFAGPDSWDPENLRALLGEYTDSQKPC
jgi:hypothetical protein